MSRNEMEAAHRAGPTSAMPPFACEGVAWIRLHSSCHHQIRSRSLHLVAKPYPDERPPRVTIKDVARLSGVSQATVTRALNGSPRVRPETRRKVEEACLTLGYRPHSLARALVTGTSNTIGLLVPSIGDAYWGTLAAGVEERAGEHGLAVLLANSQGDPTREQQMIELFLGKSVDGIAVGAAVSDPLKWLSPRDRGLPVVIISSDAKLSDRELRAAHSLPLSELETWPQAPELDGPFRVVDSDNRQAGFLAGSHLVELGHRRIAFVGGAPIYSSVYRLIGFRTALAVAGLTPVAILDAPETLQAGQEAASQLLSMREPPTAIFAYSDMLAIGLMRGVRQLGLSVPEDLSVVGVDDIEVSAFVDPPLTTIHQPKAEIGRSAVDALLSKETSLEPYTLAGSLTVRSSTGTPRSVGAEPVRAEVSR